VTADRIFDRSGSLRAPAWRELAGECRAVVREVRRRPAVHVPAVPRGDGHPVIVLPAFLTSDWTSRGFRKWMSELGYQVDGWGGGVNLGPTARALRSVERVLHRRTAASGRRASLVGYSLGGVLARVLANAYPDKVRRVITICSPFRLPTASPLEPLYHALAPLHRGQREILAYLETPPPVPTTAIYTPTDGVVAWQSCIDEPGPDRENIAVDGPHTTMLVNPGALAVIAERLARP
jgi:pimeloyl-ACP methyl ester carboxylesterase